MDGLIALGLHEPPGGALLTALRPVIDRALTTLADLLSAGTDSVQKRAALAEIDRGRSAVAGEHDPSRLELVTKPVFDACLQAAHELSSQRAVRQFEVNSLIALVREAVTAVAGDHKSFDTHFSASTQRFEEMVVCDDLNQLKERLASEVSVLKRVAADRRKNWESTVSVFELKVATLERQLVDTKREAALDPLTKVANRRTFDRVCKSWIDDRKSTFVLALLDLDDFKGINDTHGHSVGDRVLTLVAQTLKSAVRAVDLVARFGGDEFAVLASGVTLAQAESRMKAVATKLAAATVVPGESVGITISCGIAAYAFGDTVDGLMHRADEALYTSKRGGKNRISTQTPSA